MDSQKIRIIKKEEITPEHKCTHEAYEYTKYEVIKRTATSQSYVAIYEIPPHKSNYPYHYHLKNEEVFYIISGVGTLETPDGNQKVTAGDIIVCPNGAQGAHKLTNGSETEKLVYIDFDVTHSPEVVYYPHTNKMGLIVQGESSTFFKRESAVDYYEG